MKGSFQSEEIPNSKSFTAKQCVGKLLSGEWPVALLEAGSENELHVEDEESGEEDVQATEGAEDEADPEIEADSEDKVEVTHKEKKLWPRQ